MKIRKRILPSGEMRWLVDYKDAKGKRRAKQFRRKSDAETYSISTGYDLRRGLHVAPGESPTICDAGAAWLERCHRDRLARSTLKQYRQHLDQHIAPEIGTVKLADLTGPAIYDFLDMLLSKVSRQTARKILTSLGSIVDEAIRRGLHVHNPVRSVTLPRTAAEETEGDALEMPTKDELRAILAQASARWRPLLVTAIFTGMRGSELRGLKWSDVDLKAAVVHVRRRADQWNDFGPPKSKAGKREIPLAPVVVNELRRWRLACPNGDLDLVFPAPDGRVVSHSCILKDGFGPLQVAARIVTPDAKPRYGLHALRHAAAALFIEQGLSPKRIQVIMGHASIKMTFDIYGYLFRSDDEDREAMAQIEERLIGGATPRPDRAVR